MNLTRPSNTRHYGALALAALVLLPSLLACATLSGPMPVENAPLSPTERAALKRTLVGTWRHTHGYKRGRAPRTVRGDLLWWTFGPDGALTQVQRSESSTIESGRWSLDGRNIVLELSNSEVVTYRAEEWQADRMTWFNYTMGDFFIVQREPTY
ncbi:MAG: hypothetical protein AAGI01_11535 [Myxococcota bacterium]